MGIFNVKPDPDPDSKVAGAHIWGQKDQERFESKFERGDPDECWLWKGAKNDRGYGLFRLGGRVRRAHVAAWLLYRAPIPAGLVVDHVAARGCANLDCVNPAHLEPVTQRENILRGRSIAATRARQTHCYRGHEFTEENTARHHGWRRCKTCHREDERARHAAKREKAKNV